MKEIEYKIFRALRDGDEFFDGPGYGKAQWRDQVKGGVYHLHGEIVASVSPDMDSIMLFAHDMNRLKQDRINAILNGFGLWNKRIMRLDRGEYAWKDRMYDHKFMELRYFDIADVVATCGDIKEKGRNI